MYVNGQLIFDDRHFRDHHECGVPVQVYWGKEHHDIGYVEHISPSYIKMNNIFYSRKQFTFVSRPGY
ncbi:hypothetical protein I8J29_28075 [Paenibacillus sp. MWE-103]|uniref:Uncharacterized protein n=1 Tax=Paenibacillus artemisiicola TaxID=1172618 RepID=A0ABS3WIC0_9BACL|nr:MULTISPECIES: hypothetical protein [Paenibacillus]MBO7748058.1 hypothetical protein [Paenibacillus artemisiicola]SFJ87474.1 hypothetical protein SAMN02799624_06393 [Paenibacillus sp. UNC496MF]